MNNHTYILVKMMVSIIPKQSQQNNSCVANEIDTQTHILANNDETRFVWTLDVSRHLEHNWIIQLYMTNFLLVLVGWLYNIKSPESSSQHFTSPSPFTTHDFDRAFASVTRKRCATSGGGGPIRGTPIPRRIGSRGTDPPFIGSHSKKAHESSPKLGS